MLPTDPPRKPWKRLLKFFLAAILSVALAVVSLPWLASTSPVRALIVSTANQTLSPSRLEIGSLRFSWFGKQEMRGVVLRDKEGKALVTIPRLTLSRTLPSLALGNPIGGLLVLEGANIDIERRANGSIDLADALAPLLESDSKREVGNDPGRNAPSKKTGGAAASISVKLVNGSLLVRAPELPEPLKARRFDLSANLPATKGPLTWRVALAKPTENDDATLEITGELDHRSTTAGIPPLSAKLIARHWPWSVDSGGVTIRGRLDGTYTTARKAEQWSFAGNGDVLALEASGAALAGDHLTLDRLGGNYEVAETNGGWDVRQLDLACPLGSLKATAKVASSSQSLSTRVQGQLDLAALARQLPHILHIRDGLTVEKGSARLDVEIADANPGPGRKLVAEARVSDLTARDRGRLIAIRDPASLSAHIVQRPDDLKVERLAMKTAFLDATGSGDLVSGVKVSATVDLEGLKNQMRDLIDFGTLDLAGKGRIAFEFRRPDRQRYTGRLAAEFLALRVVGLTAEPIARNALRLDAGASGPLVDSALPASWNLAQFVLKTDDLTASTRLSSTTTDGAFQIDELRLALVPPPQNPAPPTVLDPIRLAAKGRFDPRTGTLELRPLPDATKPEPVALGEGGVTIIGLNLGKGLHVEGTLTGDLARIDRTYAWWTGGTAMDLSGALSVKSGFDLKADGKLTASTTIQSPDLSLAGSAGNPRRVLAPAVLAMHTESTTSFDQIEVVNVAMAIRHASVHAKGNLSTNGNRRFADFAGTLDPNWTILDPLVAESIEPGAKVRFVPRPFKLRGPLTAQGSGSVLQELEAELGLDRFETVAFGLRVAPTPVVLHWRGGVGVIDPIETTINQGRTILKPGLDVDKNGILTFRLAPGSEIQGAEINDEVSRSLLAYVAPVLHDATRATGKASVTVSRADYPLNGDETTHSTLIGKVEFHDVSFTPGPFAGELLTLTGQRGTSGLRLDQPIELAIADGRVNQRGLVIPVGRDAKLEFEGSVGFDKTIAMRAKVPVTPGMLGNSQEANELLEGLRVGLPIGGTLSHPTIDRRGLRVGLRDAGKSVLKRGAADLLNNLAKPPRANAPRNPRIR
jgi:translocation and assembly module TamB